MPNLLDILIAMKWMNLFQVAAAAIGFTAGITLLFSLGIRLITNAEFAVQKAGTGKAKAQRAEVFNLIGSYVLFALCGLALLYGIYLVVPYFHTA